MHLFPSSKDEKTGQIKFVYVYGREEVEDDVWKMG